MDIYAQETGMAQRCPFDRITDFVQLSFILVMQTFSHTPLTYCTAHAEEASRKRTTLREVKFNKNRLIWLQPWVRKFMKLQRDVSSV